MKQILGFILLSCLLESVSAEIVRQVRPVMGTFLEIQLVEEDNTYPEDLLEQAFTLATDYERRWSVFQEDSLLSKINREAAIEPVLLDPETAELLSDGLTTAEESGGAFDPSVGSLLALWGFYSSFRVPADAELTQVRKITGWSLIEISSAPYAVRFRVPGVKLDFGGMAKGYAVDALVRLLRAGGKKNFLINMGGNIYANGWVDGLKQPWLVGIRHPRNKKEIWGELRLHNQGVATSGDYERFFQYRRKRYSHIFDPRTAQPVQGMIAVTVIAPSAYLADLYSTTVFVLGKKKGLDFLNKKLQIEGVLFVPDKRDDEFTVFFSSGFQRYLSSD